MTTNDTGPPDALRIRFETTYGATYAAVLRLAQRRVHTSHAEDVFADVFVVAWRRIEDLPVEPDEARAWLFGVARRILLSSQRAEHRRNSLTVRIADDQISGRLGAASTPTSSCTASTSRRHGDVSAPCTRRASPSSSGTTSPAVVSTERFGASTRPLPAR